MTLYQQLTPEAQTALIHDIAEYRNTVLPRLVAYGKSVPSSEIPSIVKGAEFLSYWPQYASFVQKAIHSTVNLHRIVYSLQYLMGLLSDELSAEMTVNTPDGRRVIVLSQTQSLRRGRPTAAESEQRRRDEEAAARAQALAHLTGNVISTSDPAPIDTSRPTDTSRRKHDTEPDLFSAAVAESIHTSESIHTQQPSSADANNPAPQQPSSDNPAPNQPSSADAQSALPSTVSASYSEGVLEPSAVLPRLRELKWAMPDALSVSVSELRDLYAVRANESNTAKMLLEQGASIAEMSEHTRAAKEAERSITHTLRQVDEHLAWLYVMLTEVNADWQNILERRAKQTGTHPDKLIILLKPYALKQAAVSADSMRSSEWFNRTLASCRKANDAAIAAATRDPEKDKEMHKMDAYIRRKDLKVSAKRLSTMQLYRAKLADMGADSDSLSAYDVFISAVAQELAEAENTRNT